MGFLRIIVVLALAACPLSAQTRIAGVDVGQAFRAYHLTKSSLQEFDKERATIGRDPRKEQVDQLAKEVKQAMEDLARVPGENEVAVLEAERLAEFKRDELRALTGALRDGRAQRTTDLNRRLVANTRKLLDTVRQVATAIGKERGFDVVVDTSGNTNTGLPVLLYARDMPDLTGDVIARLNQDAPPAAEAPEKPATGEPASAASND